jgi:hypothetical protein
VDKVGRNSFLNPVTNLWRASLAALAACVLLAGCASTLPVKTLVRQSPGYDAANIDRVGVFVDAAISYDAISAKYVDIADSRMAIASLSEKTKSALAQKGYAADLIEAPFVGGFLVDQSVQVAQDRHGDHKPMPAPFEIGVPDDPAWRTALYKVSQGAMNAFKDHPDTLNSDPAVRSGLAQIAAKKHIRYLLVVQGSGLVESGLKQAGQAVGTAVLTALVTLGTVSVSTHSVSWLDSFVSLIDLQNSDILWSNGVRLERFNPADPKEYDKNDWSRQVLYWLPVHSDSNARKMSVK